MDYSLLVGIHNLDQAAKEKKVIVLLISLQIFNRWLKRFIE